jgi:hypothetical protein
MAIASLSFKPCSYQQAVNSLLWKSIVAPLTHVPGSILAEKRDSLPADLLSGMPHGSDPDASDGGQGSPLWLSFDIVAGVANFFGRGVL